MKKQLIMFLLVLLSVGIGMAQCDPDPIEEHFITQGQIDSFSINFPGCTEIIGDIWIDDFSDGSITNLNGLSQVTSVSGSVYIMDNIALTDLSGLENLVSVGGEFIIFKNYLLTDLSGLESLESVDSLFRIMLNYYLTSLTGLENLNSISYELEISNNNSLLSLSGLSGLQNIAGGLDIRNNPNLLNLSGLENLNSVSGKLTIAGNATMNSLSGLDSLTTVDSVFLIDACPALENLSGLSSLNTAGSLILKNNDLLVNLNGLESLTSIGDFEIRNNDSLASLTGLEGLTSIDGKLFITSNALTNLIGLDNLTSSEGLFMLYNPVMVDLTGLNNLQSIGSEGLELLYSPSLQDLSALSNLTSIEGFLVFRLLDSLETLNGLESLQSIGGALNIDANPILHDITGIANANLTAYTDEILISGNDSLSICGQANICDFIINGGNLVLYPNAPGCNTISEILAGCYDDVDHLVGRIIADQDQDCEEDSGEPTAGNILINAYNDDYSITISTDSLGNYWLPLFEDTWYLNVLSPVSFWTPCFTDTLIEVNGVGDTIVTDFILMPEAECPYIDWEMTMPLLRICRDRIFTIDYCNYGGSLLEDVIFSITLDSFLILQNASVPYTIGPDGEILFEIDTLEIFECGQFSFTAFVDCDSLVPGDVQCVHVEVLPDDLCSPNSLWDESTIVANGFCENDSIYFELENIGTGNMEGPAQFRIDIVIDDIVLLYDADDYQLDAGEKIMLSYEKDGIGMRLSTDQAMDHPVPDEVSVIVPNCEDMANNIIFNLLPVNNGDPYSEIFCLPVIASCDPNLKYGLPTGTGENNEIEKGWELNYTIQFQNTGNDTAFLVVVRDTLDENLDLTTLRVRGASHPFTWTLNPNRELVFTFENILLPDSTTNEPLSHGLVGFSITPKSDLLPGALIENRVGIYFDFNDPVITNTVFHTIRKPVVVSSEHLEWCTGEEYFGLPIWQDTSIQILTEFLEYDSIHFVHFDLSTYIIDTVDLDIEIGAYFENILILGDTTFTISYENSGECDSLVTYYVSGLTGAEEVNGIFKNTKVYPNPVSDFLIISNHQTGDAQEWTLVNNLGIPVWQKSIKANEVLARIKMNDFPSGIYWLKVKSETGTGVWRIARQ